MMQQAFDQTKRVYPRLPAGTHPDVVKAFNDLHDNVYSLRDQVQKMQSEKRQGETKPDRKPFTLDIAGIKVKAPTDSASLQNGMTLKYNSSSGQFEFSL